MTKPITIKKISVSNVTCGVESKEIKHVRIVSLSPMKPRKSNKSLCIRSTLVTLLSYIVSVDSYFLRFYVSVTLNKLTLYIN